MIRKVYMIEGFNKKYDVVMRRYAANMKTAEKIAKPYGDYAVIRHVPKNEWIYVNPDDVERL